MSRPKLSPMLLVSIISAVLLPVVGIGFAFAFLSIEPASKLVVGLGIAAILWSLVIVSALLYVKATKPKS